MMPSTRGRPRAVDEPLTPDQEALLADLVDALSERRGAEATEFLETMAAAHPALHHRDHQPRQRCRG